MRGTILFGLFLAAGLAAAAPTAAFEVTGRFLYEDRLWDKDGYTGLVQNLPIRHCEVEIVDAVTTTVLASGVTDDAGNYAIEVTGQTLPVSFYARCLTEGAGAGYHITVVEDFQRNFVTGDLVITGATHAITTSTELLHDPGLDHDFGDYLIQDADGTGVAQAFNIFDNAVDFFDWMAQPGLLGRLPDASEFVVYGWGPLSPNEGSNYSIQGILISSPGQGNDTDGWSDTVILHETGHWYDDLFSRSDNPGGPHFLGDNNANVLLAYGEGAATFHCAKVRDRRAQTRLNLLGQPVDAHVSYYADLQIPPAVPTPGGLSFSYDFEHGVLGDGTDLGQIGTANETNVTSAQWDLVDGPGTPDESPGVDDDPVAVGHGITFDIENVYLPSVPPANPITIEDYVQGWFARNGAGFLQAGLDSIFIGLNRMEFYADASEPDDAPAQAGALTPLPHAAGPAGSVVINEIDPGVQDAIELYNASDVPVDLTGWEIEVYVNGVANDASRIYVFPPFTLQAGEVVTVYERGDPLNNGTYHLYAGETPMAFNASWAHGGDGACVLRDALAGPVDFVRWRDVLGVDNTTPVPAGTAWTGLLDSPASPNDLGRDIDGSDTDDASDWSETAATPASVNHPSPEHHTLYDTGDADVFAFSAAAGTRYGFEARAYFSATDPRLELLGPGGEVLGSNDDVDPGIRDARLDFYAPATGTYYLRVTHVGPNTDWGVYDLAAFVRPVDAVFAPPASVTATPDNASDVADPVEVTWLNAGAYDAVRVYRDGTMIAELPGSPSSYGDAADRGVHRYEVSGVLGGMETATASDHAFAGRISCSAADDFESGAADLWITEGGNWGVTPFAASGTWGFTDSPAGTYQGCPAGSGGCTVNTVAEFGVPALLPPNSTLTFDHICITEDDFDHGIVEVSVDGGASWTEIARYDQGDDPGWSDNLADPTDWRAVSLDLSAYASEYLTVRFRLQSDQLVELDGWYVDNVSVNDAGCTPLGIESPPDAGGFRLMAPSPNPTTASAVVAFSLPRAADVTVAIFDVAGRLAGGESLGRREAGVHRWVWDGRDGAGRTAAAGVYYIRLRAGDVERTQRLVRTTR